MLIIGRSGTGKTITIIIDMLIKKYLLGKQIVNVFTTISPFLL